MAKRIADLNSYIQHLQLENGEVIDEYYLCDGSWEDELSFVDEDGSKLPVEFIEQDGGGEGGTEYCETILKVGDNFVKITYRYYSHHGYEFDGATVYSVTPIEKMVTIYE